MRSLILLVLLSGGVAFAAPAEPVLRSTGLVERLTTALSARQLDAVAAPHPGEADRFVAALFIQGTQLLVVSARHTSPAVLQTKMASEKYRDVYLDLHGAAIPGSSWFIQDMAADGLCASRDQTADILYANGTTPTIFDADWRAHNLSQREYASQLATADERYSALLEILLAQVEAE